MNLSEYFHLPEYFVGDIAATIAFGIVAILLLVFGYKVFDKLVGGIDFDDALNKGNIAVAIVVGSFLLGLCYVIARVIAAIVG